MMNSEENKLLEENKFLEGLLQDAKDKQKYIIPDWLEKLNQLEMLKQFMTIDFTAATAEEILHISENLQQELKRCGIHNHKGELHYFDGKEIYSIK